jgi:hypothetical protein
VTGSLHRCPGGSPDTTLDTFPDIPDGLCLALPWFHNRFGIGWGRHQRRPKQTETLTPEALSSLMTDLFCHGDQQDGHGHEEDYEFSGGHFFGYGGLVGVGVVVVGWLVVGCLGWMVGVDWAKAFYTRRPTLLPETVLP